MLTFFNVCIMVRQHLSIPWKSESTSHVISILLYATKTLTMLVSNIKNPEAYHIKCQKQRECKSERQQFVCNYKQEDDCDHRSLLHWYRAPCLAVVIPSLDRLHEETPAHKVLRRHVNLAFGRQQRVERLSRATRCRWTDHIPKYNNEQHSTADLW